MMENIDKIVGGAQASGAFVIKNVSGEEVPAFSACQISTMSINTTTGGRVFEVIKPNADSKSHIVFTAKHKIPASTTDQIVLPRATIDANYGGICVTYSGAVPAVGDDVGVASGKWTVETGKIGFVVVGVDSTKNVCWVKPTGGGGSSGSTIKLVQAQANGSNGLVSVKDVILKSTLSASPNFETTGSAYNVAYIRVG